MLKPYSTIWEYGLEKSEKTTHKTQKPVRMIDNIVKISSNEGDLVYIPFAGSGSEVISCIKLNRKWIASELSIDYINLINNRIDKLK